MYSLGVCELVEIIGNPTHNYRKELFEIYFK